MIPTYELTEIVRIASDAGAKVLVTGDPEQLDAIGAGGALRLLADATSAIHLEEVRRFTAEWERDASLRIRDGEARALLQYDRHGRLRGGSEEDMVQAAVRGFLGDHLAGKRSILTVDSNERAAELSARIREELVRLRLVEEEGIGLRDGTRAGRGDLIQTRRNEYRLDDPVTGGQFTVVNREVWRVEDVDPLGRWLTVRQDVGRDDGGEERWGPVQHLPAEYVREDVTLAYTSSVHVAEGRTVDTSHSLVESSWDRAVYYVATTRGVESNVAYMVTGGMPDEEDHYLARLAEVLERQEGDRTATHVQAEEFAAADHLGRLGPEWSVLIAEDSERRYRHALEITLGEEGARDVANDEASGPLYRLLRTAELAGHDVPALIDDVVTRRELDSADSIAEVLHYRVERYLDEHSERRREDDDAHRKHEEFAYRSYADRTPAPTATPGGAAVTEYLQQLAAVMDERVAALAEEVASNPPAWAEPLGPVPDDPIDRLEWTERVSAVVAYREQFGVGDDEEAVGPRPPQGNPERRAAWDQAADTLQIRGAEREMSGYTAGELANIIETCTREEAWLPPNVDDRLREASIAAREAEASVAWIYAELGAMSSRDPGRDDITDRLAEAESRAAHMRDRVSSLEEIAEVRTATVASIADVREEARAAREELRRRGIDPETLQRHEEETEAEPVSARARGDEPERAPEWEMDHADGRVATRGNDGDADVRDQAEALVRAWLDAEHGAVHEQRVTEPVPVVDDAEVSRRVQFEERLERLEGLISEIRPGRDAGVSSLTRRTGGTSIPRRRSVVTGERTSSVRLRWNRRWARRPKTLRTTGCTPPTSPRRGSPPNRKPSGSTHERSRRSIRRACDAR